MLTVVNFAHGAFFMVGAYAGCGLPRLTGSFWCGLLVTPLVVGAARPADRVSWCGRSMVVDRRPAAADLRPQLRAGRRRAHRVRHDGMPFPTPAALAAWSTSASATSRSIGCSSSASALVVVLRCGCSSRRPFGLIIRAGARDPRSCACSASTCRKVWLLVFGLGTAIARPVGGVLAAPTRGRQPGNGHRRAGREPSSSPSSAAWARCRARSSPACSVGIVFSMTSLFAPEMAELSIFVLMAWCCWCGRKACSASRRDRSEP